MLSILTNLMQCNVNLVNLLIFTDKRWKEEKHDKKTGDIVESCKNEKGRKVYRCGR